MQNLRQALHSYSRQSAPLADLLPPTTPVVGGKIRASPGTGSSSRPPATGCIEATLPVCRARCVRASCSRPLPGPSAESSHSFSNGHGSDAAGNGPDAVPSWAQSAGPEASSHQQQPQPAAPRLNFTASLDEESWPGEFVADEDFMPPAPSNLPTNGGQPSFEDADDMRPVDDGQLLFPPRPEQLRKGMGGLWTLTDQPGIDFLLAADSACRHMPHVYVILFGVGERETEGIYSLRAFSGDGVPHETIIAFESEEDAQRYAGLLEASMDHTPNVCSIPPRELLNFCKDQGYSCRLEPAGSLLIPPDFNVHVTDWERSLRLREGKFSVLDEEPHGAAAAQQQSARGVGLGLAPPKAQQQQLANLMQAKPGSASSSLARYTSLGSQELDVIRARLEALLPPSGGDGHGSAHHDDDSRDSQR